MLNMSFAAVAIAFVFVMKMKNFSRVYIEGLEVSGIQDNEFDIHLKKFIKHEDSLILKGQ